MTEDDYVAIGIPTDPRFCYVEELGDLEYPGDLSEARSLKAGFPSTLKVDLAKDGGDLVTDFVGNVLDILIASEKSKGILEAEGIGEGRAAEYLPIVLRDRRGKAFKEPFFIVNILTVVSCFDWDRSTYKTFKTNPREISRLKVLHLIPGAIPKDAKLFRVGELRREIVIRTDLLERLKSSGCEGLRLIPMGEERLL